MVAQWPEAGVEDGYLQPALAVERGAHGKVHHLLTHLERERPYSVHVCVCVCVCVCAHALTVALMVWASVTRMV